MREFRARTCPDNKKAPLKTRLLAPPPGLEPGTYRLTADRSAIELWWNIYNVANNIKMHKICQAQNWAKF